MTLNSPTIRTSETSDKTLIVLNPHAGGGKAGRLWTQIEPLLWAALGDLTIAVTQHSDDVALHLDKARAAGITRVIAIGGDGTNYALINTLMRLNVENPNAPRMTFGCLPIGTGHDWARTLGIPNTPAAAVRWIAGAHSTPIDLGRIRFTAHDQPVERHFLNIASAGIGGAIDRRVNLQMRRRPWTFLSATVATLLFDQPQPMCVTLDDQPWYDGRAYVLAVANGRSFGHGMKIAPDALYDDGLFDVVLIEGMPRLQALAALNTVYSGAHIQRADVHVARARSVQIEATQAIGLDLDGEAAEGGAIRFDVLPRALDVLTLSDALL